MNIYLIYGIDRALIINKTNEIIKKLDINKDSIIKYSLNENNLNEILEDASTINLFSEKKIIVINDANIFTGSNNIDTTNLEKYLNNYNELTYMIFSFIGDKVDSRKKIYKIIKEKGQIIEINSKTNDNYSYVLNYIKENNYQMSSMDIRYFLSKVGNDINNINNELNKLFLLKINDKIILKEDIDNIVITNIEEDIFKFIDSITNKDKNKVISLYHEFLNNNYEPIMLISMIASKFRLIYQVKRLISNKYSDEEISKKLSSHVYPIKLARNLSYGYSEGELLNILLALANLDKDIKLGNINNEVGLELFLLKI